MPGERPFGQPGESPMTRTGGLPFFGNLYSGRIDNNNYAPQAQGGSKDLQGFDKSMWDDPNVRARIDECPYFALCDQVIFHNMDPNYLDPGLLTPEEHHLLLLYSRAYYEKWGTIRARPPNIVPHLRFKYGGTALLDSITDLLDLPRENIKTLKQEYFFDDSCLIAMDPSLWRTAYLDPANRDHLSGRILDFGDIEKSKQEKFFLLLDQMRRIRVVRHDQGEEEKVEIIPFRNAVTLYDFSKYLGLKPYQGHLKVYDYVDTKKTAKVFTVKTEDDFFDFLVALFYSADIGEATLQADLADANDNTCRYSIVVEPFSIDDRRQGRWF
ncbi:hypothetical protein AGDE_08580 [Angomonas deanei]|uniref:Uncharacterized protein n=1 Tax=Angomonas deanei TaxID=59799 RepID=A0A7G2C8A9_9TRYP|nr:hypothetical protein AGDE_08580 [Angomonas deanei]CAD2214973.1 hypothetical protein, conserved [Angomonas deanei]|eukprot:EPY32553.1 hypothetical protein AGDE_08580 [Angomonas deanei]